MKRSVMTWTTRMGLVAVLTIALVGLAEAGSDTAIQRAIADPGRSDADRTRDATSKPAHVLEFFRVGPGMVVIDLFGGGGYYSEMVASVVGPTGTVYLHNNQAYLPYVGEELEARFSDDRLSGVVRIVSEVDDLQLPESRADVVLMVMSYHDLFYVDEGWPAIDRENFWSQVHAALKPGGTLAVIDHVAESGTGSAAAQDLHRIDMDFAKEDIEAAGFVFVASSDVLRNPDDDHTLLVFDPAIRRKTDRFVYRFKKAEATATPATLELSDELKATEVAFAQTMADRDHAAFTSFLAEETVFFGGEKEMRGKAEVAAAWKPFFDGPAAPFSWQPDTAAVLESGTLGLTSGPVFAPDGTRIGTFNSVWRRGPDGTWKVVFDRGCPDCECPPADDPAD